MKKRLASLMILLFMFVFVSCGGVLTVSSTIETQTTTEAQTTIITEEVTTNEQTSMIQTTEEVTTDSNNTEVTTTEPQTSEEITTQEVTTEVPTTEITTEELQPNVEINLYSINDFHGGAYSDMSMISKISAYLKGLDEYHLEVSAGDIFQGTALSNYYHGEVLVDALNEAGFDGFVIGNHEFDWDIDTIGEYADSDLENGEFNSPILAANIVYEDTGEILDFAVPYTIETFEGVKVAVIGLIGQVESSIAASRLENILFLDPVETAAKNAKELREEHGVDVVVVYVHDSSYRNDDYANLTGSERIDAMFNGHSHTYETSSISRPGVDLPYAQMNNYDVSLVKIQLIYNRESGTVTEFEVEGISNNYLNDTDPVVDQILATYETDSVYVNYISEVLTTVESDYWRSDLAEWGASVIRDYLNIDVGAVNAGGFRVTMEEGDLTVGELITIYPFDNVIKTSDLTGQQLLSLYQNANGKDIVFDDSIEYNSYSHTLTIDGQAVILDQYYTVGAVDYIFDKEDYGFLDGINVQQTIYYMRDLLTKDLKLATEGFNPADGSHYID